MVRYALPRIHPFIPVGTILEIAPGYGRWTHYLKDWIDVKQTVSLLTAGRNGFAETICSHEPAN
ncbi:MAG: hypothetical protein AABN95_11100 [Acidobacteriota bacterium]